MHVATTKKTYRGKVYTTHLLRRTYREGGKVKHKTLANLSHLPEDLIELIRRRLKGEPLGGPVRIVRNWPHGHVAAVLGTLRAVGLEQMLGSRRCRERDLVVAMIVQRVLSPCSKLATGRELRQATATNSLCLEFELSELKDRELYKALDWLLRRQSRIEGKLARRHLKDGTLLLYDLSSSYYTGRRSELVKDGYNRDGKRGHPQIVYGLLCDGEGRPIAIEVFPGNTADPSTLKSQIRKVRKRFGVERVAFVGDRGLITSKRIEEELREVEGLDWITALRADTVKRLARQGVIQPSLFDERGLAEVSSPDFPGERLIVCRNPFLAEERRRKREELLSRTERELKKIEAAVRRARKPLRGEAEIGKRVGEVINRYKMGKHFGWEISDRSFRFWRKEESIREEESLDGIYVIRTSISADALGSESTVRAYKDLSKVERAFRCMKTVDLQIRPIYHWKEERIRAHVFLCMLAYYVEWHLRRAWRPLLFEDEEREAAEALRASVVEPAPRSEGAKRKERVKRNGADEPVHSFGGLLRYLGTLCINKVCMEQAPEASWHQVTEAEPLQRRAFELLGLPVPK